MAGTNTHIKIVAQNRKARHDYHIEEKYEAGIELTGTEVKSLRQGKASIKEAYAVAEGSELMLVGCHIPPYEQGNIHNVDPMRRRKLLLKRGEIDKLIGAAARHGYSLVPLTIYFKNGWAKLELGVAKGKKDYDKREDIKRRDQEREIQRAMRQERR